MCFIIIQITENVSLEDVYSSRSLRRTGMFIGIVNGAL